jgi:hypothetical protein
VKPGEYKCFHGHLKKGPRVCEQFLQLISFRTAATARLQSAMNAFEDIERLALIVDRFKVPYEVEYAVSAVWSRSPSPQPLANIALIEPSLCRDLARGGGGQPAHYVK